MSVVRDRMGTRSDTAVWSALGTVRDPELDEPITDLGFVSLVRVSEGAATVELRLPTYFCAPNFAYLMVADARDAVGRVAGIESVTIRLVDHFASEEINAGVSSDAGFVGAFPEQARAELADLRRAFQRKAHAACLERACRRLVDQGWQVESLDQARLSDLPDVADRASLLRRRADLGLSVEPGSSLVVDEDGERVPAEKVSAHLRFAKTVRVSIEGNAGLCRGLLRTRYGDGTDPGTRSGVTAGEVTR
ncbi:MAG: iron-sulfur cluster assembly protein [Actinomycetes bacterium]